MKEMKYIKTEDHGMVIFENSIQHRYMARWLGSKVISAGFVSKDQNGELCCYGKSTSLGIDSDPETDTKRLSRLL